MDTKARLVEILGCTQWNDTAERIADALLAAGVTLPEPPGPVTSTGTAKKWMAFTATPEELRQSEVALTQMFLDRILPDLARDHGLIPLAEVERRARAWAKERGWVVGGSCPSGIPDSLVAALTAPQEAP